MYYYSVRCDPKATFLILNATHKHSLVQRLGVFSFSMAKHQQHPSVKIHHGSMEGKVIFSLYSYWHANVFGYLYTPNLSKHIIHSYGYTNMQNVYRFFLKGKATLKYSVFPNGVLLQMQTYRGDNMALFYRRLEI